MVYSNGPEKERLEDWQLFCCSCCLASAAAEAAEAGLPAADVLVMRWWWLEERRLVLVCPQVKMVAVCQCVCSSSQTEDFQLSLKVLICCVGL